MTREKAIEYGERVIDLGLNDETQAFCKRAIKALKHEPFINKPCVSAGVCEHDKMQVLDKIRAEIDSLHNGCGLFNDGVDASLEIIDKCRKGEQK